MIRWLSASLLLIGCGGRSDLGLGGGGGASEQPRRVASLALGWNHSCAHLSDGRVACWGSDTGGQLGDGKGTMTGQSTPKLLASAEHVQSLAGGYEHGCAVQKTGTLACWGNDSFGAVGADTQENHLPWTVIGAGFRAVSAGFDRTCAVRSDGTAACWGVGDHGELGNGASSFVVEHTPTPVQGLTDAVSIAVSEWVSCALIANGSVKCWGLAPVGDGTMNDSAVPVSVIGLEASARQIAAGAEHACALLEGGLVTCWGYGGYGELGLGPETVWAAAPVAIPDASPARAISAGEYHTCAVLEDGSVRCWGNEVPELQGSFTPVPVGGAQGAREFGETRDPTPNLFTEFLHRSCSRALR